MKKKLMNKKTQFIMGIIYIGAGVTFFAAVNRGIGIALMAFGIILMVSSKYKK